MTLLQTLNKSIKKALANDYQPMVGYKIKHFKVTVNKAGFGHIAWLLEHERGDEIVLSQVTFSINDVLFDHGFLKALYGNADPTRANDMVSFDVDLPPAWKYHVQQLALLETNKGRINYIGSTI